MGLLFGNQRCGNVRRMGQKSGSGSVRKQCFQRRERGARLIGKAAGKRETNVFWEMLMSGQLDKIGIHLGYLPNESPFSSVISPDEEVLPLGQRARSRVTAAVAEYKFVI